MCLKSDIHISIFIFSKIFNFDIFMKKRDFRFWENPLCIYIYIEREGFWKMKKIENVGFEDFENWHIQKIDIWDVVSKCLRE